MGSAARALQKRHQAKRLLSDAMADAGHVVVIHYSCESFYDRPDGTSPRITSIAVRNLATGQTSSFSIHQVAERCHVLDQIEGHYNDLEKEMLDDFYSYVHGHGGYKWLHWNMRDVNYGFPAIAHRYKVLGGNPIEIPETFLIDLNRLLIAIYGIGYIGHPRLTELVEKNKISNKDFLTGADEAKAFENKEYVKLHFSTLRKVDILANIAERTDRGDLKTNSTWRDYWGLFPQIVGDWFKENWVASLLLGISAIVGFILTIISLFK
jgi:hypothetical protein